MGYRAGLRAYQQAVAQLSVEHLTHHYTHGLSFFQEEFATFLRKQLTELSGGVWDFRDFVAYAAGADTDLMAHVIEGVGGANVFPGDWHGFRVGVSRPETVTFGRSRGSKLACLCVPSVRNGHLTEEMVKFLSDAGSCLLNINLYPTLAPEERRQVAVALEPVLDKSLISVSFSRGFGLTASQFGVLLVQQNHPLRARFREQWEWHTYFYNAIAARAFMALDFADVARVDSERRAAVEAFLRRHDLQAAGGGTYYVKAFAPASKVPATLEPLSRNGLIRLCFKPDIVE